jgi:NAD(P)-dependent dehydrogenase (short-subunit alcohol dehydrogenase family)
MLNGRVIVITGAARGIGRAIAEALVERGAQPVLTDTDEEAVMEAAVNLDAPGLPARQGRLLRALYFEGDSVAQLAGRWGINAQAVQNIHVKALKALRVRLKRLGVRRADG